MSNLTDRQQRMLTFERQWWKRDDALVPELFGCGLEQYQDELAQLLASPEALTCDPLLVRRLRRHVVPQRGTGIHPAGRARLPR
jgi:hypothetical protein